MFNNTEPRSRSMVGLVRNTRLIQPSTTSHDYVSFLHFPKKSTKQSRSLSAGETFPLSICYSAGLPCCEVSSIALPDAACSALSAVSRSPPKVTLHSPWCRRFTLGGKCLDLQSVLIVGLSGVFAPNRLIPQYATVMRANSENTAYLRDPG